MEALCLEVKQPGLEADHYLHLHLHSPISLHDVSWDVNLLTLWTCHVWMVTGSLTLHKKIKTETNYNWADCMNGNRQNE